jgi:hypothetical protein
MISQIRQLAPRVHLPLRQLAVCLDCDECFGLGLETCPSCGSATWTSLSRFLGAAASSRPQRRLDGSSSVVNDNAKQPERVRQCVIGPPDRRRVHDSASRDAGRPPAPPRPSGGPPRAASRSREVRANIVSFSWNGVGCPGGASGSDARSIACRSAGPTRLGLDLTLHSIVAEVARIQAAPEPATGLTKYWTIP